MKSIVMVLSAMALGGVHAADYFYFYTEYLTAADTPVWAAVDQTSSQGPISINGMSGGNDYWIVSEFKAGTVKACSPLKYKVEQDWNLPSGTTLNLGSPADSPFGATSGTFRLSIGNTRSLGGSIRWYDGAFENNQTYKNPRILDVGGSLAVEQSESAQHVLRQNYSAEKPYHFPIKVSAKISSSASDAVITCTSSGPNTLENLLKQVHSSSGYYLFSGDNSDYRGAFSLESAFRPFRIEGTQTLGDPSVTNAAALKICNDGAFAVGSNSGTPTRGICLDGETAYLIAWSDACTGYSLAYPISRKDGVAGALVKIGAGLVTLNAAYTAGDLVVSNGTLVIGADATLPAGQKIVVCDGAILKLLYNTQIDYKSVEVTTQGTGTVAYEDGYRLVDGEWEASVTMTVEGDGTADATAWEKIGATVMRTATAGGDAFLQWKGALTNLVDRNAYATSVRVRVTGPISLTASFGSLVPPEDVTCGDGSTFSFADRTMTVVVPADTVSTYDYAASVSSGYVTNIVKAGAGDLTLVAAAGYAGDFTVGAGRILVTTVGALGHDDIGCVTVADGAALVNNFNGPDASCGKCFRLRGATAYVNLVNNKDVFPIAGTFVLDGDASLVSSDSTGALKSGFGIRNSKFDLNGHVLKVELMKYGEISLVDVVFTNSAAQAAQITYKSNSQRYILTRVTFAGSSESVFSPGSGTVVINDVMADWTLSLTNRYSSTLNTPEVSASGNTLVYRWDGPVELSCKPSEGQMVTLGSASKVMAMTFGGPLTTTCDGNGIKIYAFCNILGSANFRRGAEVRACSETVRTGLYLWNGATYACGEGYALTLFGTDLWMDDASAFAVGDLVCTNDCRILGGPVDTAACGRATVAGVTQADPGGETQVLTIDSPARFGTVSVSSKLELASGKTAEQLPVFDDLRFAVGTTFDMKGNDLTVAGLTGFPLIDNPGALTIVGTWTIDQADILAGKCLNLGGKSLTFADGAKIVVTNRSASSTDSFVIAQAAGGIFGTPTVKGWSRGVKIQGGNLTLVPSGIIIVIK